jgi:hypothetical protein
VSSDVHGLKDLSREEVWASKLMMMLTTTSKQKKGLGQGDPMSPILFNIVADMLSILIKRAKDDGQIKGDIPHLVDDGLSILQYGDDTILFMDLDLEQAKNMKLLLCVFEQLSGLKINFRKSEIFCYGEAKHYEQEYTRLFGCDYDPFLSYTWVFQ